MSEEKKIPQEFISAVSSDFISTEFIPAAAAEFLNQDDLISFRTAVHSLIPKAYIMPINFIVELTNPTVAELKGITRFHDVAGISIIGLKDLLPGRQVFTGRGYEKDYSNATDYLAKFTDLRYLQLQNYSHQDSTINFLPLLTKLESLSLIGINMGENFPSIHNLTSISGTLRYFTQFFDSYNSFPKIEKLSLTGDMHILSGNNEEYFSTETSSLLTKFPNLISLTIDSNRDIRRKHIRIIANMSRLKNVELRNCYRLDNPEFYVLTNLDRLDLTNCSLTNTDLISLSQLTNLLHLNIDSNRFTSINSLVTLTNLLHLSIGSNELITINPLIALTNLKFLNISYCTIQDNSESIISYLPSLEEFHMNRIDVSVLRYVGRIPTLIKLSLRNISNTLSRYTVFLSGNLTLKYLDMSSCKTNDDDLKIIGSLVNLEYLDISGNHTHYTDFGLRYLTNLTKIIHLDMSENKYITSQGVSKLETLYSLSILNLDRCNLDERLLLVLLKLGSLSQVSFGGRDVAIPQEAVNEFQIKRPNVRVKFDSIILGRGARLLESDTEESENDEGDGQEGDEDEGDINEQEGIDNEEDETE